MEKTIAIEVWNCSVGLVVRTTGKETRNDTEKQAFCQTGVWGQIQPGTKTGRPEAYKEEG